MFDSNTFFSLPKKTLSLEVSKELSLLNLHSKNCTFNPEEYEIDWDYTEDYEEDYEDEEEFDE